MVSTAQRSSLTRQFVVPLAVLSAALLTAVMALGWWQMTRQLEAQLLQRARTIARTVRFSGDSANSRDEMTRLIRTLVAGGDVEFVAVVGMEPLRVMVTSRSQWQGLNVERLAPAEIDPRVIDALREHREFGVLHRASARYFFIEALDVRRAPPLHDAQVLLALNVGPVQEQIISSLRLLLLGLSALGAVGLAGFAVLLRARVIAPLSRLADAFGRPDGPTEPPAPATATAREIATLGAALTSAFGQVRELNCDLEQRVRDRTAELVASLDRERELGRLRANFIGIVSHEYRNSLGTILSSAQILERYGDRLSSEERSRHVHQITASCGRLAALVEDVLLYSRSEGGRLEVNAVPLDLGALARAEAAVAAHDAGAGADRIVFSSPGFVDPVVSDENLLHHVLSNLLANAVKYSPPESSVEFGLRREGDRAVFTVRDRGIGIPADELSRLGEAFFRGRNVAAYPGTGLGFVMVRRCLDLIGGTIRIESTVGEGTTAIVTLPLAGPPPAATLS
jgi:signal transduction histidine kinase